jgi:N-acetylornithine carbamoyltransferase
MNGLYKLAELDVNLVEALSDRATELRRGATPAQFEGLALGLLFLAPSLRTQASMQRAAGLLGLDLVQLSGSSMWGLETGDGVVMDSDAAEHVREAAPVLSGYVDALCVRSFARFEDLARDLADDVFQGFVQHSSVPVVSMESALWHPLQALADRATLDQLKVSTRAKLVLTWTWHPRSLPHAVANSTVCMATQRGMDVVLACPPGWELHEEVIAQAKVLADLNGGSFEVTNDPEATKDADIVYAKSWSSLGSWGDKAGESFKKLELRNWQVTPESLGSGARFMHCLPVRRNVVVSDAVLDGPASLVLRQAENRLHAQTAVLEHMLSTTTGSESPLELPVEVGA